jgi:hypothetical protein
MLKIKRTYKPNCTLGILTSDKFEETLYTLELQWKDNQSNISCIPAGTYNIVKHFSLKFKDCFSVLDVKNRKDVLIHVGNTTKDTHGCILVGMSTNNKDMILESKKALRFLLEKLDKKEILIIE